MTMINRCPGTDNIRTPTLTIKICPVCGSEIELFSIDVQAVCEKCGFVAYNDTKTCIQWCKYARLCVGDELYERLKGENTLNSKTAD